MPRNITVTFSDGSQHIYANAPDSLTPDQVSARAQKDFGKQVTALDGGKSAAPEAHNDSFIGGMIAGAMKPIDNLAAAASHIPYVGPAIDKFGQSLGMPSVAQANSDRDAYRQANTQKVGQIAGNIAGTLPATALKGGVAAQGAISGALLSDEKTPIGILKDAAIGAGTSFGANALLKGASNALAPKVTKTLQTLHDAGIMVSPGQYLEAVGSKAGKLVRSAEDKMRSVPVLGGFITGSRDRGTEQLNRAVANDALSSIGKKVPDNVPVGHDLIDHVSDQLSSQYKAVVPKLVGHLDQQFVDDLTAAKALTNALPDARQAQFKNIVDDIYSNRVKNGSISGQDLKDAESRLTLLISRNAKSPDADQKGLAEALTAVRQGLRDLAVRSDPASGGDLKAVNAGWAKLKQMQAAANVNGVVLPKALLRVANKTGQGKDLARAAGSILPDHVPNSGTADRAALMKMGGDLLAGGGAGGALLAGGHPGALLLGGAAIAPYTSAGQRVMNSLLIRNASPKTQKAAQMLNALADRSAAYAPAALNGMRK